MQPVIIIINNYHNNNQDKWLFVYAQHCFTLRSSKCADATTIFFFVVWINCRRKSFKAGQNRETKKNTRWKKSNRNAKLSVDDGDDDGGWDEEKNTMNKLSCSSDGFIYINGHIDCLLVFTTLCMLQHGLHKERTSKYEWNIRRGCEAHRRRASSLRKCKFLMSWKQLFSTGRSSSTTTTSARAPMANGMVFSSLSTMTSSSVASSGEWSCARFNYYSHHISYRTVHNASININERNARTQTRVKRKTKQIRNVRWPAIARSACASSIQVGSDEYGHDNISFFPISICSENATNLVVATATHMPLENLRIRRWCCLATHNVPINETVNTESRMTQKGKHTHTAYRAMPRQTKSSTNIKM